jgi:1-aminocyclopropane-1-carboxylate deaminase/D-cysteine desulfhydrase-like pyridoxal-dependent ACC family enzyme
MSGVIRNLTALGDLRILEVRAGHATLQTMHYFSWSVVCIGSESTKAEMLVQFLNEVLGACQTVGLHVVATV